MNEPEHSILYVCQQKKKKKKKRLKLAYAFARF